MLGNLTLVKKALVGCSLVFVLLMLAKAHAGLPFGTLAKGASKAFHRFSESFVREAFVQVPPEVEKDLAQIWRRLHFGTPQEKYFYRLLLPLVLTDMPDEKIVSALPVLARMSFAEVEQEIPELRRIVPPDYRPDLSDETWGDYAVVPGEVLDKVMDQVEKMIRNPRNDNQALAPAWQIPANRWGRGLENKRKITDVPTWQAVKGERWRYVDIYRLEKAGEEVGEQVDGGKHIYDELPIKHWRYPRRDNRQYPDRGDGGTALELPIREQTLQ